jgi:hypothetical protein
MVLVFLCFLDIFLVIEVAKQRLEGVARILVTY